MCGRYTLSKPADAIAAHFELDGVPELAPRYNIAPSTSVPMVVARPDGRRVAGLARWGLEAGGRAAAPGRSFINARAETVAERPAFRVSFERRRCLVPADGFFEWRRENGKQPYYFTLAGGGLFAFAGLWRRGVDDAPTVAILTTRPNDVVAPIHARMPAIVPPRLYGRWLEKRALSADELAELTEPWRSSVMEVRPVSRIVNSPANDSPACIERSG